MDKGFLEGCLEEGMSLKQIGELSDRAPGTVGYWVKRHGLVANGSARFRPGKGLERAALEPLISRGMTLSQIAADQQVSIKTVRYWIERFGLESPAEVRAAAKLERLRSGETRELRCCARHGESEHVMDSSGAWRCRTCRQEAVVRRRRKLKRILVNEAGGCCSVCGYDRCVAALQFHHLDPESKRFGVSQRGHSIAIERVREEVAKCVLLCANCHAELEAGLTESPSTGSRQVPLAPRPGLEPGNRH